MYKFIHLLILSIISYSASAANVMGFEQPEELQIQRHTLHLNGYGIRSKWLMNIYTAGLYLEKTNLQPTADWVAYADAPMALRLVVMRDNLNSQRMVAATRQGFELSNGAQPLLKEELKQFLELYQKSVQKRDVYTISYHPEAGLRTYKNQQLINTSLSLSFKQAVFKMWFGDQPVQTRLKKQLLNH